MRLQNILLILVCLLVIPFIGIKAECIGWSVAINKQDTALCSAQSIELNMIVHNDTASIDSCEYCWYVKKPSSTQYELLAEKTVSTTYLFNEVGVYFVKAAARPNECTIFFESSPVAIELYPSLIAGTIGSDQVICYNSTPVALSQEIAPSGGNNEISYQWQKITDGDSFWSNIDGECGTTLILKQLTQSAKYRLQYSSCDAIEYSNEVTITVRTPTTAPAISSDVSILCYNQGTATISISHEAVGASDETFNYQWQESYDGATFTDIHGATNTTFVTPTQTVTKWYRVVAISSRGCGSVASSPVKVDVYPDWSIFIDDIDPLCYMTGGEISVSASGAEEDYIYQWQNSNNGLNFENIPSANSSHYQIPGKTSGIYYYRALVAPTNGCLSKFSDTIQVLVYNDFVSGTIEGTDTVCMNGTPREFVQTIRPTGGDGQYTYQWQYKTDGNWQNIQGATDTTCQVSTLSETTKYRLVASSSCEDSIISNEIEVYVRKALTKPVISIPDSACYGMQPDAISITTLSIPDLTDSVLYQWQEREVGGEWIPAAGETGYTFQPQAITTDHEYRVVAKSLKGCDSIVSESCLVEVHDSLVITTYPISPLCYMTQGTVGVSAVGSGNRYAYQWQDSVDGNWQNVPSEGNNAQYTTEKKEGNTYYYRCIVIPINGCPQDTSAVIPVVVYSDIVSGTIEGTDTVCMNGTPRKFVQTIRPTGGDGQFTYQWQYKTDGDWQNIQGATDTTCQVTTLSETTKYRLIASSSCEDSIISNEIEVYVRKALTKPVISSPDSACYGMQPDAISITTLSIPDPTDSVLYQWQERVVGGEWMPVAGETGYTFQPKAITTDHEYRVVAKSLKGCDSIVSESCLVEVHDSLVITTYPISSLCYMTQGTVGVSAVGSGNRYTYQWQDSVDGNWQNVPSEGNNTQYTTEKKEGNTYYYRCIVIPINGCPQDTSAVIPVVVYNDIVSGTIEGTDTVCMNGTPREFVQTIKPTGGDGQYTYQWQNKTDGNWQNIQGTTDTTCQVTTLSETTKYRLVASSSCQDSIISNEIEVYVRKALTKPVISIPDSACYGMQPDAISITTLSIPDPTDSVLYQWQEREVGGEWMPAVGETGYTFQPKAITTDHEYRVVAKSLKGCDSIVSDSCIVGVYDDLKISISGEHTLCYMRSGNIQVEAHGSGNRYTYQWQDSINGIWNDLDNSESSNPFVYATLPKEGGYYYYRCIVNPILGCTPDTGEVFEVHVLDSVYPGTIKLMGADTICYGAIPDSIKQNIPTSGGNGKYTYQWRFREEGSSDFVPISYGATNKDYQPGNLYKTTEYQLEVTDSCGEPKYTNIVTIVVRSELQRPVLNDYADTICYNTIPDAISIKKYASGGVDDSFTYQWFSMTEGESEFNIIDGETDSTYYPKKPLLKTTFYQLRATSAKCGDVLISNSIKVNVFDSLDITTNNPDTLCNMTSTTLSVYPIGGGNSYSYQWQDSVEGGKWKDILEDGQKQQYITMELGAGDHYYKCIVYANKCNDYYRESPIITVSVYEPLDPGTIIGTDSTCYGYAPETELYIDKKPSGVDGKYSYQWQELQNGKWIPISGKTGDSYPPGELYEGKAYRLEVSSKCERRYTDSIFIRVNPLPVVPDISGPDSVCYNQHEIYSFAKEQGYSYEWEIKYGNGEKTTESYYSDTIDILWKNPNTNDTIILIVTDNKTKCTNEQIFGVSICNEQAPERTIIIRKPNSNILICEEDGEMIYQWGYTEKTTQQEFTIEDSNRRYVLLPHTFDDVTYDYWLTLRHSESSPCYSKSYYSASTDVIKTLSDNIIYVPSFIKGQIPIIVNNPGKKLIICSIYSISGESLARYELGNESYLSTTLPITLHAGMYVMYVTIGDYVKSIKLIAE